MKPYTTLEDIQQARELLSPPGDTLDETLGALHMTQAELSTRMGRPTKTINEIVQGKAAITPETALALEMVLGVPATFWLERERLYQLHLAELNRAEQHLNDSAWAKQFPAREMADLGYWEPGATIGADAICRYFNVASREGFERHYAQQLARANFRHSGKGASQPLSVAAWLRRGEIQADAVTAPEFQKAHLKAALPPLRTLMADGPEDWFAQAQALCLHAGVVLVHTPPLKGAPVSGAARWYHDKPLVQLSGRHKRYDSHWFTLFHELGHILLHSKRDFFLDFGEEPGTTVADPEAEANAFAQTWTLSAEQEAEAAAIALQLTDRSLKDLAHRFATHPTIIVGRLQHRGLIPYSAFTWITGPGI